MKSRFGSVRRDMLLSFWTLGLLLLSNVATASEDAIAEKPTLRQHIEASTSDYPLSAFGISLRTQPILKSFYLDRNFALAWHDADYKLTPQGREIIDEIGGIAADGLSPSDYHFEALKQYAPMLEYAPSGSAEPSPQVVNSVEFDLLLSDAVITLSQHLSRGKVDPETLSPEWKAQRRNKDLATELRGLTRAEDVAARLNDLRPRQVRYFRLKKLLARLRSLEAPVWDPLAVTPMLKPGTSDPRVTAIRQRLIYWGDFAAPPIVDSDPPMVDSDSLMNEQVYDEALVLAFRNFQRRHGLDEDGVIGRVSFEALNVTPAQREQQVVNNLERWRWLTDDLGKKHVLVNIAAFELKVIDNNETVMVKPVIVGRDYRRTPVFSDRIRYLVLNPTWTAPMKLVVKDILPQVRTDPDYFNRLGFTVFDRSQNIVDPATVDWSTISGRNFPYRLVQGPGPLNAMGQVKFMFPNPFDVYLHDTPSRDLFTKKDRAFSSGCVRVSDPLELAAWLLKDNGMDSKKIEEVVAKGELQTVFLKQPIPVHIEYWTAWVDRQDEFHFRNDLYQRDPPLSLALAAPVPAL